MNLKPLNNNVIVTIETNKVKENSLFVSQSNMGEVLQGRVVSSNNPQIKENESVIFFKYCACPYTFEATPYFIINADDCVAVIRGN